MAANAQEAEFSQQGNPKREFDVVDNAGCWMKCCCLGHTAGSNDLQSDMEVVLYHTTGRGPRGSASGMLYLMKDSLIVPIGLLHLPVEKKMEIVIS